MATKDKTGKPLPPSSDYSMRPAPEVLPGGEVKKVPQPKGSYKDLIQGAMALIRHQINKGPTMWAALESGDVSDYVHVMKSFHYFTGPIQSVWAKGKLINYGYIANLKRNMPYFEVPPTLLDGTVTSLRAPEAEHTPAPLKIDDF